MFLTMEGFRVTIFAHSKHPNQMPMASYSRLILTILIRFPHKRQSLNHLQLTTNRLQMIGWIEDARLND